MPLINRVPLGFLGLFDSKTQGKNPDEFDGNLSPGVEMTNFYGFSKGYQIETASSPASITTGVKATVTVPADKLWLVYGVHAQVIAAVAGLMAFTAALVDVRGGTPATTIDLMTAKNFNLGLADEDSAVMNRTTPFLIGQGQGLAVRVVRVDGTVSLTPTIRAWVVELDG